MIKLINNELIKVKKTKIIFTQALLIISLIIMNKYSDKSIIDLSFNLIPFIGILTSILFGGIINSEIENGTFRFYLTKPYKRWKIYLSKLLCIFIYIICSIIFIIITSFVISHNIDFNYLKKYIVYSIPLFFIGVFVIYLSSIFKSQTFSSSISILVLCFSFVISQLLFNYNIKFIEYTFLPYLDYSIFKDKLVLFDLNSEYGINLSLKNAILLDLIYMLLLYSYGSYRFIKKDIKC